MAEINQVGTKGSGYPVEPHLLLLGDRVLLHHHLDEGVGGLAGQLNARLRADMQPLGVVSVRGVHMVLP